MERAGAEAHKAAQQQGCNLQECMINCWAAWLHEYGMPEGEAEGEIMRIFAGSRPELRLAVDIRNAIRKLKDLGVWPF